MLHADEIILELARVLVGRVHEPTQPLREVHRAGARSLYGGQALELCLDA